MQANQLRHIKSGHEFNGYFPIATGIDAVVATSAGLDQTIELIRRIVPETKSDTTGIAKRLKMKWSGPLGPLLRLYRKGFCGTAYHP